MFTFWYYLKHHLLCKPSINVSLGSRIRHFYYLFYILLHNYLEQSISLIKNYCCISFPLPPYPHARFWPWEQTLHLTHFWIIKCLLQSRLNACWMSKLYIVLQWEKRLFISLCKSLHNLSPCCPWPHYHILQSLLFLRYAKYTFMSRSLLFSLPGMFFPYFLVSIPLGFGSSGTFSWWTSPLKIPYKK